MKRCFVFLTVFLTIVFAGNARAAESWRALTTPNFYFVGDVDENAIYEHAQKLEGLRAKLQNSFGRLTLRATFRTTVLVTKDRLPYLSPNQYFISRDDANFIVIPNERVDSGVIDFAYVRFILDNNLGPSRIPAWLNIGLAEYFARPATDPGLLVEQQNNLLPLNLLLETDYYTLQNQPEERQAIFRAEALALLSFLISEKAGGRFSRIEEFVLDLMAGGDVRTSLLRKLSVDQKSFEIEFRAFLKDPKLTIARGANDFSSKILRNTTAISEARRLAILGDVLFCSNNLKAAAELLDRALRLDATDAMALSTLALVKAHEFYYDEAEILAEKAITSEPGNFLSYYRQALAASRQGMTEYGFVSGYPRPLAEKMRASLSRALELNPDFTEAAALLCFVNFVRNENLDESLRLAERALDTLPGNSRYMLRLAEIKLRIEKFAEARKLALDVFRTAPTEQLKLYSQNTIQRIDSTEYQLDRIRNERAKYVNDDLVTDKPLSEDEIRRLREKATREQIRAVLKRPRSEETRVLASLSRIECAKDRIEFFFKSATGPLKLQARSFDGISLLSFIEEMSAFRLGCGNLIRENDASIIYRPGNGTDKSGELISIEFVPRGFKLAN